jgi:hypothetical protein
MKKIIFSACVALTFLNVANAWHTEGYVYCDANQNGQLDATDTPLAGVRVIARNTAGTVQESDVTDANGFYAIYLPHVTDSYVQTLDAATLPASSTFVIPSSGQFTFTLDNQVAVLENLNYLISSPVCQPSSEGACWLTAGGTKFEALVGTHLAERGPDHSFGGNVFPSCDPDPGNGGSWNHIAHAYKLHFHGTDIHTVDCGNVPGIEPGSESPVTPFNYIEFQGFGTLKGIKGNKVDYGTVFFFARAEDRNEPGSRGAKAGVDIDRYFLHVFDANGNTLLLVDGDGNPATIDPITITGGNLQLHVSSCDDPPAP